MKKQVIIHTESEVFRQAVFTIIQAHLQYERYDGTLSSRLVRLNLERGDSVAAVIHNPADDSLLFTEQFRYPTHSKGPGWLLEIAAGMIDKDEPPADAMRREAVEETGYDISTLHYISTFYLTPGGSSERIHLYYARIQPGARVEEGGGVAGEGEDIRNIYLSVDEALERLVRGEYEDAKTIIGLQWLALNRARLASL